MNSREVPKWKDQNTLKVHLIYQNAIGLLAKLPKYPFEVGMSFYGPFWAFRILGYFNFELFLGFSDFRFLIIN
jgi:hypothetical protein